MLHRSSTTLSQLLSCCRIMRFKSNEKIKTRIQEKLFSFAPSTTSVKSFSRISMVRRKRTIGVGGKKEMFHPLQAFLSPWKNYQYKQALEASFRRVLFLLDEELEIGDVRRTTALGS